MTDSAEQLTTHHTNQLHSHSIELEDARGAPEADGGLRACRGDRSRRESTVSNHQVQFAFDELSAVAERWGAADADVLRAMRALSKAVNRLRVRSVHPAAAEYALGAQVALLLACSPPQHRHAYIEAFLDALRKDVAQLCLSMDALADQPYA